MFSPSVGSSFWVVKQLSDGWAYGPAYNEARLLHPNIVPWESLAAAERELELELCRHLLTTLACMGYRLMHTRASLEKYQAWRGVPPERAHHNPPGLPAFGHRLCLFVLLLHSTR